MRIASLLASGTELVCALGSGESLVGRSHECDRPEWVKRLPVLSHPTFDTTGSSAEIDRLVRERLQAGLPLYTVDDALLAELRPDVLITQTHCEVCAVTPADVARGTVPLLSRRKVVALQGGTLEGVFADFLEVAQVIERRDAGEKLVAELRHRVRAVRRQVECRPAVTVACLEWIDPLFGMGNWGPELVTCAGGINVIGGSGEHSTVTRWEDIVAADPDVLLVAPCGFGIDRALAEMPLLAARPGWSELRAVRTGRVVVADGNLYFNRSGPGLVDTVEILAEILHPEEALPRHRGEAWLLYPASAPGAAHAGSRE